MDKQENTREFAPRKSRNWPLFVGLLLVLIIVILAIVGPSIAPKDPAEEKNITLIDGTWYIPPFDIGTPGYPLGSDNFGRDLYSRLLWGIRPTMVMVVVVASVRLVLGVIIGLAAGWFTGKSSRFLNGLIQVALALPVLLVALGAIAIVGVELGIWAFIIGLSLTGWVDSAMQVREQTRIVKGQIYVEAASAMGASHKQILVNHILKQIGPMLLMLFAFEMSSTLMLTAGLGFLGYYIGGDVWVETADFVARRISGSPELGQMLATAWVTLTKPWALVVVGTTVFITVLGFNLIGEGLRQNMGFTKVSRKSWASEIRIRFGMWIDDSIWHPTIQVLRIKPLQLGLIAIGIFFILGLGTLSLLDAAGPSYISAVFAQNDEEINSTEEANSSSSQTPEQGQATQVEPGSMVSYEPSMEWEFFDEGGIAGGPILAADADQLVIATRDGIVNLLTLESDIIWQNTLPSGAVGTPVIDAEENIYIADETGGLNKISPHGELIWRFQTEAGNRSHSGASIAPNGNLFYTVGTAAKGFVQSVSPSGEGLWASEAQTRIFFTSPEPSRDGNYVFLKDDIFASETGEYLELEFDLDINRYFSGQDGNNYLVAGQKIIQWDQAGNSIEILDILEWDSSGFSDVVSPAFVGVDQNGNSWQIYTTPGGHTNTVWVSAEDQFLGRSRFTSSGSSFVDIQEDLSILVCGGGPFNQSVTDCALIAPTAEEPLWDLHIGNYGPVVGGFIHEDHYYIATEDGHMFMIAANRQDMVDSPDNLAQDDIQTSSMDAGFQWMYDTELTDGSIINLQKDVNGNIYITTGGEKVHILNPQGDFQNLIQLPETPFHQVSSTGRSAPLNIYPQVFPDGSFAYVSEELTLFVLNSDGEILSEQTLEFAPAEQPALTADGRLYILDAEGGLNAINNTGLLWRFQPEAANIPASGFTVGPEGNIYYVITNYSKGFIQAVSMEGEQLWVAQTTTRDFYDQLKISSDGKYLALAENLIQTVDGALINYDPPEKIDEYLFSENGQYFYRSLHTVSEWRMGPTGVEVIQQGVVSEENTTLRPPLESEADINGIIWLYYPATYTGRNINIVWMDSGGNLLGAHLIEWEFDSILSFDLDRAQLTECVRFEDNESVGCKFYQSNSSDPAGEALLQDAPAYYHGQILDGYLYLYSTDHEIYAYYLGENTSP